jgi:hypothetical protein
VGGGSKVSVVVPLSRDYSNLHAGPLVSLRKEGGPCINGGKKKRHPVVRGGPDMMRPNLYVGSRMRVGDILLIR